MATLNQEKIAELGEDRRYLPRWKSGLRALWEKVGGRRVLNGVLENLSCAGACVIGETAFAPNESVHLTIDFPWVPPIRVNGIVCWVKEVNAQKWAGIRFVNIDSATQDAILQCRRERKNVKSADFWFAGWK